MVCAIDFFYHIWHAWGKRHRQEPKKGMPAVVGVPQPERQRGVYGISVAAELVGMGVQKLRSYEARGLLEPERTDGGSRLHIEFVGFASRLCQRAARGEHDAGNPREAREHSLVPGEHHFKLLFHGPF